MNRRRDFFSMLKHVDFFTKVSTLSRFGEKILKKSEDSDRRSLQRHTFHHGVNRNFGCLGEDRKRLQAKRNSRITHAVMSRSSCAQSRSAGLFLSQRGRFNHHQPGQWEWPN